MQDTTERKDVYSRITLTRVRPVSRTLPCPGSQATSRIWVSGQQIAPGWVNSDVEYANHFSVGPRDVEV